MDRLLWLINVLTYLGFAVTLVLLLVSINLVGNSLVHRRRSSPDEVKRLQHEALRMVLVAMVSAVVFGVASALAHRLA